MPESPVVTCAAYDRGESSAHGECQRQSRRDAAICPTLARLSISRLETLVVDVVVDVVVGGKDSPRCVSMIIIARRATGKRLQNSNY